jgi:hypothetical protein
LADRILYYIDGVLRHTETIAISANMRPVVSDDTVNGPVVSVDWMRLSPYATSCAFESRIFDAGSPAQWLDLSWNGQQPAGTTVAFHTRTGSTATPDGTWSAWTAVNSPIVSPVGQYIQYRATLSTASSDQTPSVEDVIIAYNNAPTAVMLASFTATSVNTGILLEWETTAELETLGFNLYRSGQPDGVYEKLNAALIPTQNPGATFGATYIWLDTDVQLGMTYYYKLEDIDIRGNVTLTGPVNAVIAAMPTAVKVRGFAVSNLAGFLTLGGMALLAGALLLRKRRA